MSIPANEITGEGDAPYPVLEGHRAKLLHKVTRRREFKLPYRTYENAPEEMQLICEDRALRPRERIAAARVLVAMQQSNNQLQTGEARINQILNPVKVEEAPEAPESFDETRDTVFYEVVAPESKKETLRLMAEMGLLDRYLEQTGTTSAPLNGNGQGNGQANGNGKH